MPGPLEGVKVVDLTAFINGPSATGQMCEQGADVLKVEPGTGEPMRMSGGGPGIYFSTFEMYNRGKMSMTLDLKHPDSKHVMKRLVEWADVLAENFTPGVMDRLGLSYETVKGWNPRIIYASNSGFGPTGKWARRPSYDGMAQGFTGVLAANGGGPSHEPRPIGFTFSDVVGGNYFYSAILAALYGRERTNKGSHVICSQAGATLYFQRAAVSQALGNFGGAQSDDGQHAWGSPHLVFQQVHKASDGQRVVITMTKRDQLERFCKNVIKRPDLLTPSLLKRWPVCPPVDGKRLLAEVSSVVVTKPMQHWIDAMVGAKVPCSPISSYADLADKSTSVGQHMYDNGYMVDINHRDFGKLNLVGYPVEFTGTPNENIVENQSWHAPYIGEHTDLMLAKLGYSPGELDQLKNSGAVPSPSGPFAAENAKQMTVKYAAKMANKRADFIQKRKQGRSKL